MRAVIYFLPIIFLFSCQTSQNLPTSASKQELSAVAYDSHVHLMSPDLINYWKQLGIPFSKSAAHYADIDTILYYNKAQSIDLISMAYVYANPEYYAEDDARQRMAAENDYLLQTARKYPDRITPFFAVDPLRDYAAEELERCRKINSQSGLKLHFNTSQVYLTVPEHLRKVKSVFRKAAEYDLPIILHFDNWHPKFGKPDLELLADSILQDLPPLVLQIAHFGTSGGFNEKTKRFIDAFVELKEENKIPARHTILFDISAVALDKDSEGVPKLTDEGFVELAEYIDKIGIENIVFGTDYPLYRAADYVKILRDRVGLTEAEITEIQKKRAARRQRQPDRR